MNSPNAIQAEHYRRTEAALASDPIIKAMALELVKTGEDRSALIDPRGNPRWEFMMSCRDEYQKRGGLIESHLGGPSRAVLAVFDRYVLEGR